MPLIPLIENDKAFHITDYIQLKNYQWKNGIDEDDIADKKDGADASTTGKQKVKCKIKKKRIRKIMKIDF